MPLKLSRTSTVELLIARVVTLKYLTSTKSSDYNGMLEIKLNCNRCWMNLFNETLYMMMDNKKLIIFSIIYLTVELTKLEIFDGQLHFLGRFSNVIRNLFGRTNRVNFATETAIFAVPQSRTRSVTQPPEPVGASNWYWRVFRVGYLANSGHTLLSQCQFCLRCQLNNAAVTNCAEQKCGGSSINCKGCSLSRSLFDTTYSRPQWQST